MMIPHSQLSAIVLLFIGLLLCASASSKDMVFWQDIKDPSLKDALFESYMDNHFEAITRLRQAQKLNRVFDPAKSSLVLGSIYLSYGFEKEAAKIFEALLSKEQSDEVRDQAWFYLAKLYYQVGNFSKALDTLPLVGNSLDFGLRQQRYLLEANIFLQQRQYQLALDVLANIDKESIWEDYANFNRGIAHFYLGNKSDALRYLDRLGDRGAEKSEEMALRDRANLMLGLIQLQSQKPDEAIPYLERISIDGPYSNKALLALGRAYSESSHYKKSLVPWLKLVKRHPSDAAVQDGLMAVPYAFGKLDAYKQALEHYENAMALFKKEMESIDVASAAVGGGKLVEGLIRSNFLREGDEHQKRLSRIIKSPEGRYLLPLLSDHEFRRTLNNYEQLTMVLGKFERWSAVVASYEGLSERRRNIFRKRITELQSKVVHAAEKNRNHMNQLAYKHLQQRKNQLQSYFNEARFLVAQIYDYAAKRWGQGGGDVGEAKQGEGVKNE